MGPCVLGMTGARAALTSGPPSSRCIGRGSAFGGDTGHQVAPARSSPSIGDASRPRRRRPGPHRCRGTGARARRGRAPATAGPWWWRPPTSAGPAASPAPTTPISANRRAVTSTRPSSEPTALLYAATARVQALAHARRHGRPSTERRSVELGPEQLDLAGVLGQRLLLPPVGHGPQEGDERGRRGQQHVVGHGVLHETGLVLERGRQQRVARDEGHHELGRRVDPLPVLLLRQGVDVGLHLPAVTGQAGTALRSRRRPRWRRGRPASAPWRRRPRSCPRGGGPPCRDACGHCRRPR